MSLFPLDSIRNAAIDRELEPLLEDVREEIARSTEWGDSGLGDTQDILDAYDVARPRLNVLASAVQRIGCGTCLDVSTGLGFLPVILTRLGIGVSATEVDPGVASFARQRGTQVRPYRIGRDAPPFPPRSVEALIFAEVLEHVKLGPTRMLRELVSLLQPGGRFLLTTPNIARLDHIETLAAGENFLETFPEDLAEGDDPTDHIEHVREYSVREVVEAVEAAGLAIDRVVMIGWGTAGYHPVLNPFANDIIVVEASA